VQQDNNQHGPDGVIQSEESPPGSRASVVLRVTQVQPSDDRMVVVQDIVNDKVLTVGMRYRDNKWFGAHTGDDLTEFLSSAAVWFESMIHHADIASTQ
jgi:hypothetical protein